jgi:hypothetical protein
MLMRGNMNRRQFCASSVAFAAGSALGGLSEQESGFPPRVLKNDYYIEQQQTLRPCLEPQNGSNRRVVSAHAVKVLERVAASVGLMLLSRLRRSRIAPLG